VTGRDKIAVKGGGVFGNDTMKIFAINNQPEQHTMLLSLTFSGQPHIFQIKMVF